SDAFPRSAFSTAGTIRSQRRSSASRSRSASVSWPSAAGRPASTPASATKEPQRRAGQSRPLSFIDTRRYSAAPSHEIRNMIDFYALTSPNVQKIFIMLEECGLPYNLKPVDVWKAEQFTPEFTAINPLQKVPAIVDTDGPAGTPYTVIESGAILLYLAEKTGKFIPHDPVK